MTALAPDDPRHGGSGYGYSHFGCRCDACREANRAREARRREERGHELPPSDAHGKAGTYQTWGCRCRACSAAHHVEMAEQYAKRKARSTPTVSAAVEHTGHANPLPPPGSKTAASAKPPSPAEAA